MRDAENIRQLAALPIDYMGFIFYDKSPRHIIQVPELDLPTHIRKVGVFVNASTDTIRKTVIENQLDAIQLHGQESAAECAELCAAGLEVFKAFGIDTDFDWTSLQPFLPHVNYFLFDTKSVQHGGTGRTFDWEILKAYPYDKPYFLSGGLALENIPHAASIDDPRLIGFDLNSKFEIAPGFKNIDTLTQAVKIIKNEYISSR